MANISRKYDYSDLDLDFIAHPTTGDVVKKTGNDAIKRSLRNLIMMNHYDKPFQSGIGSNVNKLLFDNVNPLTMNFLRDAIMNMVGNYEPRVELKDTIIEYMADENGYNVTLVYMIKNRGEPVITTIFLERIR